MPEGDRLVRIVTADETHVYMIEPDDLARDIVGILIEEFTRKKALAFCEDLKATLPDKKTGKAELKLFLNPPVEEEEDNE